MRAAVLLGRCFNGARTPFLSRLAPRPSFRPPPCPRWGRSQRRIPVGRSVLIAALTPGAFLELAEKGDGHEGTGEKMMLEISRKEVQKGVPEEARGVSRLRQSLFVIWYCYIYDPIATGVRFVHLAIIFLPVILTAPAVWLGKRDKSRNGLRAGTLWWYGFLVNSMERAGPAFIKVGLHTGFDSY